jgi:hypothetical protein
MTATGIPGITSLYKDMDTVRTELQKVLNKLSSSDHLLGVCEEDTTHFSEDHRVCGILMSRFQDLVASQLNPLKSQVNNLQVYIMNIIYI